MVAMNLSKIYRGAETEDVREFHFNAFDDGGNLTTATHAFVVDQLQKSAPRPAASSSSQAAPAITKKELEEAYARGQREALNGAAAKLESAAQALATALKEVSQLRSAMVRNNGEDMLRLVMAVAEQVIHREVSLHPEVIAGVIEVALKASVRSDHYRIKVNPADLDAVNEHKPLFLASISGLKNLIIDADAGVTAGGCRIESDLGEVDATVETQLEAIRQALAEATTGGS